MKKFILLLAALVLATGVTPPPFGFWTSGSVGASNAHTFVAVAQSGATRAMFSDNGTSFTAASMPEANLWVSVAWFPRASGNKVFVAVSTDGTNRFAWSADGENWNSGTNPSTNKTWVAVACNTSVCVAVDGSGGTNGVAYSTDGQTWNNANAATWNGCSTNRCVVWDATNSVFVAGSNGGSGYMTSPDGQTWTGRTGCSSGQGGAAAYSSSIPIVTMVGSNGSNPIGCSTTAPTSSYSSRNMNNSGPYHDVAWSPANAIFAAVSSNGGTQNINVSTNGTSWSASDSGQTKNWKTIAWSPTAGLFVVLSNDTSNTSQVLTSATGATGTWTLRTSAAANSWNSIAASK